MADNTFRFGNNLENSDHKKKVGLAYPFVNE